MTSSTHANNMAEPAIHLERGRHGARVLFDCRNCGTPLALTPEHFSIAIGAIGIAVSPQWHCECGVRGTVKNGRVSILGRISIPPSGALAAVVAPAQRAQAVTIRSAREPEPEQEPGLEPAVKSDGEVCNLCVTAIESRNELCHHHRES